MINRAIGLLRRSFPFTYLVVPTFYGKVKAIYFEQLVDKVRKALESWKSNVLSSGGRITLIKSVLSSYPIYTLASSAVPKTTLQRMERLIAHFLWGVNSASRTHWVKWASVCTPLQQGGLGIRSMEQIRAGLHAKLMWMAMSGQSLWANFVRAKYFDGQQCIIPNASPLWKDVAAHYETLRNSSRCLFGAGYRRFWSDDWL